MSCLHEVFDVLESNIEVLSRLVEALEVSRHEELLHLHLVAGRFHLLVAIPNICCFGIVTWLRGFEISTSLTQLQREHADFL